MRSWPIGLEGLAFGGDYNPEQWPEAVWVQDVRLMREAGVNLVSVGIFSWAKLEPAPGRFAFEWLDRVLDLLHDGGIRVDLATGTAAPPPWFSRRHPESLPVLADGTYLWPGSRQAYCPSNPAFRTATAGLAERMATRYAEHPALAMWHVGNEYGCHVARCFCDISAADFRAWLQARYGDLDALNAAWGTAFWSQAYGAWEEIEPPRTTPTHANPTQQLDFARFSSDALRACYRAELDVLRRVTPDVPVTTNFMTPVFEPVDYFQWAPEIDLITTDHYLRAAEGPPTAPDLALSGDLTRGLAEGAPWLVMEHSTSAVNWQAINPAKGPGELRRNSLGHVARGSDGALFFQWRQSRAGAEKFHSGMVPHAGPDSRLFRAVCELGADLGRLAEVAGSRVEADVAMLWDYQAWWAVEQDAHPSAAVTYLDRVTAFHRALWEAAVTVDVVHPDTDLSLYKLVLVPSLYLVSDGAADNLAAYVRGGGHALVSYFSGIVDEDDAVRLGGYPGAFRELLGIRVQEFRPLLPGERLRTDDGATVTLWSEELELAGAEALTRYAEGQLAGTPLLTRHGAGAGAGAAWYAGARLDDAATARMLARVCAEAGVRPVLAQPVPGLEAVRRRGADAAYLFLLNHSSRPVRVAAGGTDLLTGERHDGAVTVAPWGAAVLREDAPGP